MTRSASACVSITSVGGVKLKLVVCDTHHMSWANSITHDAEAAQKQNDSKPSWSGATFKTMNYMYIGVKATTKRCRVLYSQLVQTLRDVISKSRNLHFRERLEFPRSWSCQGEEQAATTIACMILQKSTQSFRICKQKHVSKLIVTGGLPKEDEENKCLSSQHNHQMCVVSSDPEGSAGNA